MFGRIAIVRVELHAVERLVDGAVGKFTPLGLLRVALCKTVIFMKDYDMVRRDCIRSDSQLATMLGNDYVIAPDIVVSRTPCDDNEINGITRFVDDSVALRSDLRLKNNPLEIMHASVSVKWTMRSDRSQNSRTEALNLIRNRKGRTPHIVVVTGEPLPSRLASLALGTGDLDCVYHFALQELIQSVHEYGKDGREDLIEQLDTMVNGKRLKDISDLPLDLAC